MVFASLDSCQVLFDRTLLQAKVHPDLLKSFESAFSIWKIMGHLQSFMVFVVHVRASIQKKLSCRKSSVKQSHLMDWSVSEVQEMISLTCRGVCPCSSTSSTEACPRANKLLTQYVFPDSAAL